MSAGKAASAHRDDVAAHPPWLADKALKFLIFQTLIELKTIDPGVTAGIVLMIQTLGSVRLPAQESWDFELIVIHRLVHR